MAYGASTRIPTGFILYRDLGVIQCSVSFVPLTCYSSQCSTCASAGTNCAVLRGVPGGGHP
eukprot:803923-Rhodomonas_salina.1